MKNKTIIAAVKLGFDFENAQFETREEMEKEIFAFLHENSDKIKKSILEFCEVTQNSHGQSVNHKDFSSSGEIVDWSYYWGKRKQRVFHSDYVDLLEDGTPVIVKLYDYSAGKNVK